MIKKHGYRPTTGQLLASINETGDILGGISRVTVYDLVNKGHLVKVNIGRRGFITRASIEGYVNSLERDSQ